MTAVYKIALAGTVGLFVLVVGYYIITRTGQDQAPPGPELAQSTPDDADQADAPEQTPAPSADRTPVTPDSDTVRILGAPPSELPILPRADPVPDPDEPGDSDNTGLLPTSPSDPADSEVDPEIGPGGDPGSDPGGGTDTLPPDTEPRESPGETPPPARTYTVEANDSMWAIAQKVYGDGNLWDRIAQANPTADPAALQPGQVLRIPAPDAARQPREEPAPPAPGRTRTYTVQSGDNLSRIAQRMYGDPSKWNIIYNHNRDKIGDDPARLRVGMELTIPPGVGD